jgi:hypothetical protein
LLTGLGYVRKDLQKRGRCQDAAKDSFHAAKDSFYVAKDSFYVAKDSFYVAAQAYVICVKQVVGIMLRQQALVFALSYWPYRLSLHNISSAHYKSA